MIIKIGIDEAGRGPWAGPVFAGLVVLNQAQEEFLIKQGVTDSKKLTEKKRDALYPIILQNSLYSKVKFLPTSEVDSFGIYEGTKFLIKELVKELNLSSFELREEQEVKILIDGVFPGLILKNSTDKVVLHECMIKGDLKEPAISAASILAKVRRDAYMLKLHEKFPCYHFDKHKGYGTQLHMEMLQKFGPSKEHRRTFKPVRKFFSLDPVN